MTERIEFSCAPLRNGAERVIRVFTDRRGPVVDVFCRDLATGREFGRLCFHPEHAETLALAIAEARTARGGAVRIGEIGGREITIRVEARGGRHGAVIFTRLRGGEQLGRPVTLPAAEVDALERAADWLGPL